MSDDGSVDGEESGGSASREQKLERARQRRDLDLDALELAHEDAQFTVERTLQLFSDLSEKAFRLVRLNAVVLTILVALASQAAIRQYVNVPSVASL